MFINKKNIYLLLLLVITLLGFVLSPTYAKFSDSYISEDNVVGMNLNFDVGISKFDEFEEFIEVVVPSGGIKTFSVNINNITDKTVYYGIWYKLTSSKNSLIDKSIEIGKLLNTPNSTSGAIESTNIITTSIGIVNTTGNEIKVLIGVNSNTTSEFDIEYTNGKNLITGEVDTTISNHIKRLYDNSNNKNNVHIGGNEEKPTVTQDTINNIMLDNNAEYRYYGKNPNNYVIFNNETWRIISASTIYTGVGDTIGSTRVKLIKNNAIGSYSYDSSIATINEGKGVNDWTESDIKNTLNDLYYNTSSGECSVGLANEFTTCDFTYLGLREDARSMIDNAMYYLGGIDTTKENLYPNDYYTNERSITSVKWSGLVGLIYLSDYMYATDLNSCQKVGYSTDLTLDYRDSSCTDNNWLLDNSTKIWTITKTTNNDYTNYAIDIESGGNITNFETFLLGEVKPVVYLNSDVIITGGTGTSYDPYTIANQ